MYVCVCHAITDRQVRAAVVEGGAGSAGAVFRHHEARPRCGKCVEMVHQMVQENRRCANDPDKSCPCAASH